MSVDKKDFYGKEVTDAISEACNKLGVPQEKLEIEVVETGSTGIFGLIRKKAHIRVIVKPELEEKEEDVFEMDGLLGATSNDDAEVEPVEEPSGADTQAEDLPAAIVEKSEGEDDTKEEAVPVVVEVAEEASPESLDIVKTELLQIVELMEFPSTIELETAGLSVNCTLRGEYEENLTGPDGKVLDSLQYLLRKIVSRKVPERLRVSINVGDFREQRLEELKVKAVELAALVKEDGKTQVLPALNPSERRVIHMVLQEDKEIRSRSVGDGLFKKILIYKPGKGNSSGGRKRSQSKRRPGKSGGQQKKKDSES
jgi:spoIIIJ-associated protein